MSKAPTPYTPSPGKPRQVGRGTDAKPVPWSTSPLVDAVHMAPADTALRSSRRLRFVGLKRAGFVQRLDATADRGRVRRRLSLLTGSERSGLGSARYSEPAAPVLKPGRWPLRGLRRLLPRSSVTAPLSSARPTPRRCDHRIRFRHTGRQQDLGTAASRDGACTADVGRVCASR